MSDISPAYEPREEREPGLGFFGTIGGALKSISNKWVWIAISS